ncbi:Protein kinase protein with adenine nucleotide alpha hydrolases-like domain [Striga hermonthica]|uniref:RING-type E3 ubiquitin transferase n=1 Tax=Striga hermonthica TaxID=68872 RepID=A0A9N7NLP8_STRHE|nr:Protein kinase protein with adenine nucleotide alpha hydrolases-like domain [Striga hermonthica]
MCPNVYNHDGSPAVVAVDRDKHSTSAVKWAIEHLLTNNATLVMVHVKTRNLHNHGSNGGQPEGTGESMEEVFAHFRAFCARKRIAMQAVILEGTDVSGTLLDYIISHHITNVVLGASSRNPISRKFWTHDVPTIINKTAPDFCNVYVVSKGKTQSVRPAATRVANHSTPPRLPAPHLSSGSSVRSAHGESEESCSYRAFLAREHQKTASSETNLTNGALDHQYHDTYSRVSKLSPGDGNETPNWWSKTSSYESTTEASSRGSPYSSSFFSTDNDSTVDHESSASFSCAELRKKDRPDLAKVILPELSRLKDMGMENLSISHKNPS